MLREIDLNRSTGLVTTALALEMMLHPCINLAAYVMVAPTAQYKPPILITAARVLAPNLT